MYFGRFAPSPSGRLHFGSLYTGLAATLRAASLGGHCLTRIEDLDFPRCNPIMTPWILQELALLGLFPYSKLYLQASGNVDLAVQSHNMSVYHREIARLYNSSHAYCCNCTRAELKLHACQCRTKGIKPHLVTAPVTTTKAPTPPTNASESQASAQAQSSALAQAQSSDLVFAPTSALASDADSSSPLALNLGLALTFASDSKSFQAPALTHNLASTQSLPPETSLSPRPSAKPRLNASKHSSQSAKASLNASQNQCVSSSQYVGKRHSLGKNSSIDAGRHVEESLQDGKSSQAEKSLRAEAELNASQSPMALSAISSLNMPGKMSKESVMDDEGLFQAATAERLIIRAELQQYLQHYPSFEDVVFGQVKQPANLPTSLILQRRDGIIAYNLAVVVDDHRQGITEIVRGADLLETTFLQLALYEICGYTPPQFFHVPLMLDKQGHKLSKQNHAPAILGESLPHLCTFEAYQRLNQQSTPLIQTILSQQDKLAQEAMELISPLMQLKDPEINLLQGDGLDPDYYGALCLFACAQLADPNNVNLGVSTALQALPPCIDAQRGALELGNTNLNLTAADHAIDTHLAPPVTPKTPNTTSTSRLPRAKSAADSMIAGSTPGFPRSFAPIFGNGPAQVSVQNSKNGVTQVPAYSPSPVSGHDAAHVSTLGLAHNLTTGSTPEWFEGLADSPAKDRAKSLAAGPANNFANNVAVGSLVSGLKEGVDDSSAQMWLELVSLAHDYHELQLSLIREMASHFDEHRLQQLVKR